MKDILIFFGEGNKQTQKALKARENVINLTLLMINGLPHEIKKSNYNWDTET